MKLCSRRGDCFQISVMLNKKSFVGNKYFIWRVLDIFSNTVNYESPKGYFGLIKSKASGVFIGCVSSKLNARYDFLPCDRLDVRV